MASALGQQTRLFELDEAQRMLPLVRSIVKGMIDDHAERQRLLDSLGGHDPPARSRLATEIDSLTEKLVEAANELDALGVEFKGIDLGLVDFPSRRDGEPIYLCWRFGEDRIGYWHPVQDGYTGRRPIEPD